VQSKEPAHAESSLLGDRLTSATSSSRTARQWWSKPVVERISRVSAAVRKNAKKQ
jgi:hypothetical protein